MNELKKMIFLLMINRCLNWSSKLTLWNIYYDKIEQTFYNQALSTLYNYGVRSFEMLYKNCRIDVSKLS